MKEENGLILWRISRKNPFAIDATSGDAFAGHRGVAAPKGRIPIATHLGH
jgi:hypothetical protein